MQIEIGYEDHPDKPKMNKRPMVLTQNPYGALPGAAYYNASYAGGHEVTNVMKTLRK